MQLNLKVKLELDDQWVSHQTHEELLEYIRERMNSSLGFRGQVEMLKEVK